MLLGCHLSIAGGLHNVLLLARRYGIPTVAMFVRNQRRWRAPALTDEQVVLFRRTRAELGICPVVAHGSYLVNLAGQGLVRRASQRAMAEELGRCIRLGIDYLVIHPGSCIRTNVGIRRVVESLNRIMAKQEAAGLTARAPSAAEHGPDVPTKVLLECTAGQGASLGGTFEQLAQMLSGLEPAARFGVCLDTCHLFAMGYDIRTPEAYLRTMEEFDRVVGLRRLHVVHLNDSMRELGSRVDRHAHIGKGQIGPAGIANFVNDRRLASIPKILETPHGLSPEGKDLDEMNLSVVRGLESQSDSSQ